MKILNHLWPWIFWMTRFMAPSAFSFFFLYEFYLYDPGFVDECLNYFLSTCYIISSLLLCYFLWIPLIGWLDGEPNSVCEHYLIVSSVHSHIGCWLNLRALSGVHKIFWNWDHCLSNVDIFLSKLQSLNCKHSEQLYCQIWIERTQYQDVSNIRFLLKCWLQWLYYNIPNQSILKPKLYVMYLLNLGSWQVELTLHAYCFRTLNYGT